MPQNRSAASFFDKKGNTKYSPTRNKIRCLCTIFDVLWIDINLKNLIYEKDDHAGSGDEPGFNVVQEK